MVTTNSQENPHDDPNVSWCDLEDNEIRSKKSFLELIKHINGCDIQETCATCGYKKKSAAQELIPYLRPALKYCTRPLIVSYPQAENTLHMISVCSYQGPLEWLYIDKKGDLVLFTMDVAKLKDSDPRKHIYVEKITSVSIEQSIEKFGHREVLVGLINILKDTRHIRLQQTLAIQMREDALEKAAKIILS